VAWSSTPPAAPGGCGISGAPSGAQTAGYVLNSLTMNCTTGGAATSYKWTGPGTSGLTSQTIGPFTVNTTSTWTAVASNATGSSAPPASATVTISSGGGNYVCNMPGTNTPFPGGTVVVPMQWGAGGLYYSSGFASNGALVAYFDTPATNPSPPPTSGKGSITTVQDGGSPQLRDGSLSSSACDFTGANAAPVNIFNDNTGPVAYFTFGYAKNGYPQLQPGTRYFLNLWNPGGCAGSCDMRITFQKPNGT